MTPSKSYTNYLSAHEKWPNLYDECPQCGGPKTKKGEICSKCRIGPRTTVVQPNDPSYRYIPLTKGQYAIIETIFYDNIIQREWTTYGSKKYGFYAVSYIPKSERVGSETLIYMHRLIMGLDHNDPREVDHVLHNTLDNRRFIDGKENLRIATREENQHNRKINKNNTSGYKGVRYYEYPGQGRGRWLARIMINGNHKHLGYFPTATLAYAAYCDAAKIYHVKFACLG